MPFVFAVGIVSGLAAVVLARVSAAAMRANEIYLAEVPILACLAAILASGAFIADGYHAYELSRNTPPAGAIIGACLFGVVYVAVVCYVCIFNYQRVRRYSDSPS